MRKTITSLLLAVSLSAFAQGSTDDSYDVWNITEAEFSNIAPIELWIWGYYAGSNTLGMVKFAEHFDSPESPVKINSVKALFAKGTAANPSSTITAVICKPDDNGMPGETIASASITAADIVCNASTKPATVFTFSEPVSIDGEFFVVMEGIANASDNMYLYCLRRDEGELCTAYHLLEDEDPVTYAPLGTYTWYKNIDDPTSIAIGVNVSNDDTNSIENIVISDNHNVVEHYSINGQRVDSNHRGIQIRRNADGSTTKVITRQ